MINDTLEKIYVALVVKETEVQPVGQERSPEEGNGAPLQKWRKRETKT